MMMKLLMTLACAFALAQSHPRGPPAKIIRNTIFTDEKLEGEIFENVDAFTNIQLYNEGVNPYRLPNSTKPIHYDVFWDINTVALTYKGRVDIMLTATQAGVNEIVIHSGHTLLSNIRLTKDGEPIQITYRLDSQYEFLRIRPYMDLEYNSDSRNVYILSMEFNAAMRTDMSGIYQSWFRTDTSDPDSDISWIATTQFQGTSARYAFPCYDEPSFKATFDITIRRPTTHKSWSCTSIDRTNPAAVGYEDDVYNTTPVMSTYLLALIVADYESIPYTPDDKLLYEVIGRRQAINDNQGKYAFDVGQKLLDTMSEYTGINFYEMSENLKMTQAAIPDFSAGAMENWGLLTYREAYLMYGEGETNSFYKQLIAYILSHEIAHMWFGNLVTCDWWDVLWLNEGFARYYQYFLTDTAEEEMEFETRFIVEQVHTALLADSVDSAHPLSNPGVGSRDAVRSMFSTITYNKGAAVIRQTEHFLGLEVHKQGLRNYLKERPRYFDTVASAMITEDLRDHGACKLATEISGTQTTFKTCAFLTAMPIDLFQALESVAIKENALVAYGPEFNFIEYYKSWTEQPGHPLLNVNVNHATGEMTITQRRFSINTGFSDVAVNYIVPITFATASDPDFSNTKPSHVLTDTVSVIDRGSTGDEWVIFNKEQTGFYRVNYDDYTWDLIALALRGSQRTVIHEYNRAQIVNDVFQLARSGLMTYKRALNILGFLADETEYAPWFAAITGFNWLRNRLASTPDQLDAVNKLIARWATTVMSQLTYRDIPEEPFIESYLRYQLAPVMCAIDVSDCRDSATEQFLALINNGTDVPADSRNWVYCNGLRDGTSAEFNFLWNRFLTHNVYTEKILLLQSLGCTLDPTSLDSLLSAIVEDNQIIRPQDYTSIFNAAVNGNEENTDRVFTFIKNNLTQVRNAFDSAATPLSYISARLRSEEAVVSFQTWANDNKVELGDDYQDVYDDAATTLQSIKWAENVSSDFDDYFAGSGGSFDTTTTTTTTPPDVVTETPENLVEPVTPEFPA